MRYTLLTLVQRILSAMESDEVQSISETQEALDVANIVKECYFDIVGHFELTEDKGLFGFTASGDNTKPCLMTVPENVISFDYFKYNIADDPAEPEWRTLKQIDLDEFLYLQDGLDPDASNVSTQTVTVNSKAIVTKFRTDAFPTYYTIIGDDTLLFDAYDSTEETTLTEARSLGYGLIEPTFTLSDEFVPNLDSRQFQLLLNDAKTTAFKELKQTDNSVSAGKARRNAVKAQKDKNTQGKTGSQQPRYLYGRR